MIMRNIKLIPGILACMLPRDLYHAIIFNDNTIPLILDIVFFIYLIAFNLK